MHTPRLLAASPQPFVTGIDAAMAFYVGQLGFTIAFQYGDPPFYAQIVRDGVRLNLRHVDVMPFAAGVRRDERLLSAYVEVDDAAAMHATFAAAGVPMLHSLTRRTWGIIDFVTEDPDGNPICFAAATGPSQ